MQPVWGGSVLSLSGTSVACLWWWWHGTHGNLSGLCSSFSCTVSDCHIGDGQGFYLLVLGGGHVEGFWWWCRDSRA